MRIFYKCNPKKNKDCRKTMCGDFCTTTKHVKYARRFLGIPIPDLHATYFDRKMRRSEYDRKTLQEDFAEYKNTSGAARDREDG